jgi:putative membrane protein
MRKGRSWYVVCGWVRAPSPIRAALVNVVSMREAEMKRTFLVLTFCALLMPVASIRAHTEAASTTAAKPLPGEVAATPLPGPDRDFVQAASMSSSTEIDAAKLAQKNSNDKDVKSFAHHMTLDNTKMTVQLKNAVPHGVTVPKDNSDTSVLDSLRPLKGKAFDNAYIATSKHFQRTLMEAARYPP